MPKLHESYPEDYEIYGSCTGSGAKIQLQKVTCPECQGSGSIKKRQKIKPDPSSPRSSQPPNPKSTEELQIQFEQELGKAEQLRSSLLAAVQSSLLLSAEMMDFSGKSIRLIDPLSRSSEGKLEELQRDWAKELPSADPLLIHLREFKISCYAAETYHSLVR